MNHDVSPKPPAASGMAQSSHKNSEPSGQIADRGPRGVVPAIANVLAPALILLTPLVSFLSHHRYDYWRPESLVSIGAFLLLGLAISAVISLRSELLRPAIIGLLLVLFLDIQFQTRSSDWTGLLSGWRFASENATAVLMGGAGLIAIVSLILTWIFRRHLGTIVSSVFGVMIVSTMALPSDGLPVGETHRASTTERVNLPPVVHLVLDEHIGLAGLPKDIPGGAELRRDLETFYERYGFTVFPRAHSQYINTYESIGNMLNGEASPRYANNVVDISGKVPEFGIRLRENRWFQVLAERGYKIRIYQTDFLDLCTPDMAAIEYCLTVPSNGISSLMGAELPVDLKAWIILGRLLSGSLSIGVAKQLISRQGENNERAGDASQWLSRPPRLGAISAFSVMDRIAEDLRKAGPGTAIFAHLMAPHGAYMHDADCSLKPDIVSWVGPWARLPPSATNTPATRRARYLLYFDQVRCTQRKLAQIFEALRDTGQFADSTIIIHGDHGSRISLLAPSYEAADEVSRDDLIDSYSTLFAIRRSDMAAGQDRRQRSINSLFAGIVMNRPLAEEPAEVFIDQSIMEPELGRPYLSTPMPELGN
jgi:hypothetical protein